MITELTSLLEQTIHIKTHLDDEDFFKTDRDQFILTLQERLDARQDLIKYFDQLKSKRGQEPLSFTDEEKLIKDNIIKMDKELKDLMLVRLKQHHAEWRLVRQKSKTVSNYARLNTLPNQNGAFYDKRN